MHPEHILWTMSPQMKLGIACHSYNGRPIWALQRGLFKLASKCIIMLDLHFVTATDSHQLHPLIGTDLTVWDRLDITVSFLVNLYISIADRRLLSSL